MANIPAINPRATIMIPSEIIAFFDIAPANPHITNAADNDNSKIDKLAAAAIAFSQGSFATMYITPANAPSARVIVIIVFNAPPAYFDTYVNTENMPRTPAKQAEAVATFFGSRKDSAIIEPDNKAITAANTIISFMVFLAYFVTLTSTANIPRSIETHIVPLQTSSGSNTLSIAIEATNISIAADIVKNILPASAAFSPANSETLMIAANNTRTYVITVRPLSISAGFKPANIFIHVPIDNNAVAIPANSIPALYASFPVNAEAINMVPNNTVIAYTAYIALFMSSFFISAIVRKVTPNDNIAADIPKNISPADPENCPANLDNAMNPATTAINPETMAIPTLRSLGSILPISLMQPTIIANDNEILRNIVPTLLAYCAFSFK